MDDAEDEQADEKEALDDSVESLCFSFTFLFKLISYNDNTEDFHSAPHRICYKHNRSKLRHGSKNVETS